MTKLIFSFFAMFFFTSNTVVIKMPMIILQNKLEFFGYLPNMASIVNFLKQAYIVKKEFIKNKYPYFSVVKKETKYDLDPTETVKTLCLKSKNFGARAVNFTSYFCRDICEILIRPSVVEK
jgi:hypothetical protein